MQCDSLIIYYKKKTKTNKPRVFVSISPAHYKEKNWMEWFKQNHGSREEVNWEGFSHCTGNIVAKVSAVDEPYMGGNSARLEIAYSCNKCHQTHWGDLLPSEYTISEWVTNSIKKA